MSSREKRKFRRFSFPGIVKCHVTMRLDPMVFEDIPVVSLSAGGMFAIFDGSNTEQLPIGSRFSSIEFDIDTLAKIEPGGEVVYRLDTGLSMGYGIAFLELTSEQIMHLDEFVNHQIRGKKFIPGPE